MTDSGYKAARRWRLLPFLMIAFAAVLTASQGNKRPDYSLFLHRESAHRKDCAVCHKFPSPNWKEVRKGDEAFQDITDFPQHAACLSCHQTQFFQGRRPEICTNCHVNPSPKDSRRYPFPSLGEAFDESEKGRREYPQFTVGFP